MKAIAPGAGTAMLAPEALVSKAVSGPKFGANKVVGANENEDWPAPIASNSKLATK